MALYEVSVPHEVSYLVEAEDMSDVRKEFLSKWIVLVPRIYSLKEASEDAERKGYKRDFK